MELNFYLTPFKPKKYHQTILLISTCRNVKSTPICLHDLKKKTLIKYKIDNGIKNWIDGYIKFIFSFWDDRAGGFVASKKSKRILILELKSHQNFDFGILQVKFELLTKIIIPRAANKKKEISPQYKLQRLQRLQRLYTKKVYTGLQKLNPRFGFDLLKKYDVNIFEQYPVISGIIVNNVNNSDEMFWKNLLDITKEIYELFQVKFDKKVSWVNVFNLILAVSHNYSLEYRNDVYMESWYTRYYDCDESKQIYTQFKLCINQKFNLGELKEIQNSAKSYVPLYTYCFVNVPSMNGKFYEIEKKVSHMTTIYILASEFLKKLDKTNPWYNEILSLTKKKYNYEKNNDNFVLFGEGTSYVYPSRKKINTSMCHPKFSGYSRDLNNLESSEFYTHFMSCSTTDFFYDLGIEGFYFCSKNKGYCITYNQLIKGEYILVPKPRFSKKFVDYCIDCSRKRLYIPKFKSNEIPFISNEDIPRKKKNIENFLNSMLLVKKKLSKKKSRAAILLSLDDLMKKKVRSLFDGIKIIDWKIRMPFYNSYIYLIKTC